MFYEMRTYTLKPTRMTDWLALYQSDALAVQTEHLGQLVGFFTTEFGEANQVVHIWAYDSLDDRSKRRAAMAHAGLPSAARTRNWMQSSPWSLASCDRPGSRPCSDLT